MIQLTLNLPPKYRLLAIHLMHDNTWAVTLGLAEPLYHYKLCSGYGRSADIAAAAELAVRDCDRQVTQSQQKKESIFDGLEINL